ncbi:hypothetical protein [Lumpy skin disease virus]|uniref:EEV host range protein n=1 Tax=Lumpy skin disease virus TaxID=59509 RepID=A0A1B3B6D6_LSDV|nr:EEV Host range protein [Lumpy skin disease virus NI-2490]AOE47716.1 EEV Host range protein [Lumpy skin disease virus]AAK85102.1 LSDV141 putative EEV host range protein [Lumpy skin disease virus NI-2490]QEJ78688.1 hypothetical protein LSD-Kenya_141 [Lumpy skin disease virus]QNN94450.1 putative EEV host range protein [Lumpy skin disease virus]QOQ86260.1 putative EEV host range protein [Lumpy skin disease virus]
MKNIHMLLILLCNKVYSLCDLNKCCYPPSIKNGYIYNEKTEYNIGSNVTFFCGNNTRGVSYTLVGEKNIICEKDGKWNKEFPVCKIIRCRFPALQNGFVNGIPDSRKFYYESEVSFSCKPGFVLIGTKYSVCGINSSWIPKVPICSRDNITYNKIYINKVNIDDNFFNQINNSNTYYFDKILQINNVNRYTLIFFVVVSIKILFGFVFIFFSCNKKPLDSIKYYK